MPGNELAARKIGMAARTAIVAIPACNEARRIRHCLAALAVQRDRFGAPIPVGTFEILVFANNCTDDTIAIVEAFQTACPHPIVLVAEQLAPEKSNAGWARKRAMDLAASRLIASERHDGLILTTDADSLVSLTWLDANFWAFAEGADAVAGYIDAHSAEILDLGPVFLNRGRLEDTYLRLIAEIHALCDPRQHDPWPNHRVSSGASLAVSLSAYLAIGGLPPIPVGEDAALTYALECAGYKVRHAMDVCVSTSCRFDGRAKGGAADTMRYRHGTPDAPCDNELEPILFVLRRTLYKSLVRRWHDCKPTLSGRDWGRRLGLAASTIEALQTASAHGGFEDFWRRLSLASPMLRQRPTLLPSSLPHEIARAQGFVRLLREVRIGTTSGRADKFVHSESHESAAA